MNMPQVDTYGTQQPIALLKLLLEKGGMYDRGKDLNWKLFKDVFFIAAMGKVCKLWVYNRFDYSSYKCYYLCVLCNLRL